MFTGGWTPVCFILDLTSRNLGCGGQIKNVLNLDDLDDPNEYKYVLKIECRECPYLRGK